MTMLTFAIVSHLAGSSYFAKLLGRGWKIVDPRIRSDQCQLH